MRRLLVLFSAFGVLAVSALPAGADHSWATFHWGRTANPFAVSLVDSMTADWDALLGPVSADWTASSVLDTPVAAGDDSSRTRVRCPAPTGQVRVCNAAYGFNGWLGVAEIWVKNSHIRRARARVNDSYFSLSPYADPTARRHVLCQEVGHTLGLHHQSAVTCMNDLEGLLDPAYVSPNAHDYEQLGTIYGSHTDPSSTVVSAPSQGGGQGSGGVSVIVTPDGDETLFIWIFWAS